MSSTPNIGKQEVLKTDIWTLLSSFVNDDVPISWKHIESMVEDERDYSYKQVSNPNN